MVFLIDGPYLKIYVWTYTESVKKNFSSLVWVVCGCFWSRIVNNNGTQAQKHVAKIATLNISLHFDDLSVIEYMI